MRTLHDVQHEIDILIKEEWHSHYWAPLSSLARLTEEVGELAREINAQYGEKPKKASEGAGISRPKWVISSSSWLRWQTLPALISIAPSRRLWPSINSAMQSAGSRHHLASIQLIRDAV